MGDDDTFGAHFQRLADIDLVGAGEPDHGGYAGEACRHNLLFQLGADAKRCVLDIEIDEIVSPVADCLDDAKRPGEQTESEYGTLFHTLFQ